MRFFSLLLVFALLTFPSCFVADSLFLEDEPAQTLPFDIIVKDSVYMYIKKNRKPAEQYLSYGYEPLKVIVPQIIKEKEQWESNRGNPLFDSKMVEREIAERDSIIEARQLTKKISINHTFSLRNKNDSIVNLQDVTFILSNELEVLDYIPNYQVQLSQSQERLFAKLLYETPILKAYSYTESQELSKAFYQFFKQEWERKENSLHKNRFLKHTLLVVEEVDRINLFDVQTVAQASLVNHMRTIRTDIQMYEPTNFSPLYEINEDEKLVGYYFFHTFRYQSEEEQAFMSIYVKLNPFYEIERIIETDQEYDIYEKE